MKMDFLLATQFHGRDFIHLQCTSLLVFSQSVQGIEKCLWNAE